MRMHRSLILAAAVSALAAGPALAQEGGLDAVEMSITISPVTDVADVGASTDLSVEPRDRTDEVGEYHILLPLQADRDGDRDQEASGEGDRDRSGELDHERDMDRGTELNVDHDDAGGDLGVPDTSDTPDTVDTPDTIDAPDTIDTPDTVDAPDSPDTGETTETDLHD